MATGEASSLPPGMPAPGETIDGKYLLVRVIGTGGMGVVFEAEHLRLKQRCAIKMLSPEMLREKEIVHRFEREARASALLRSPHVTRVTDVATTPQGVPYIVMELLSGQDLDALLQACGHIPCAEAVDYLLQACAAVAEAHGAGIIHRDLKPGNLFLASGEEGPIVKVLDFGISKMVEEESKLTSANMTMGTALYMSPEQLRSAATVDARSDIWSLGIILYELLCGEPPFVGTAPQIAAAIVSEDAPDITRRCPIPPALGAIIHRALRRAPAERFATVAELAAALAPFAPPESLGRAVAAQISRRGSPRPHHADSSSSLEPRPGPAVVAEARTEVATSVAHEVNTSLRRDSSSRQVLLAALAVIGVVATLGVIALAVVMLRRPAAVAPVASGSASVVVVSGAERDPQPDLAASSAASAAAVAAAASAAPVTSAAASTSASAPAVTDLAPAPHATTAGKAGTASNAAPVGQARPPASAATTPSNRPAAPPKPQASAVYNPPFLN